MSKAGGEAKTLADLEEFWAKAASIADVAQKGVSEPGNDKCKIRSIRRNRRDKNIRRTRSGR